MEAVTGSPRDLRLRVLAAIMLVLGATLPPAALADPLAAGKVEAISDRTPFPDSCGAPRIQRGAEAGPVVAVNPRDPRNLVAAFEQDLDEGQNALSVLVVVSRDGAETFHRVLVPGLSRCTGGDPLYVADPTLAFGGDGVLYLSTLSRSGKTAVQVARSPAGGTTWERPIQVAPDATNGVVAADPAVSGRAYLVVTTPMAQGRAVQLATTSDGGSTWSAPRSIYEPLSDFPRLHDLTILADGTLLVVLEQSSRVALPEIAGASGNSGTPLLALRSSDRGETWSDPVELSRLPDTALPHDPERGEPGKNEGALGAPAIATAAATTDGAAVAWQSNTAVDAGQILVARSRDAGATWTKPAPVASPEAQVFTPELATAPDGTLGLSWYDLRSDRRGDEELTTTAHFAHSHDGGATWSETPLGSPFDLRRAPEHYGRSLGLRQGVAPLPGGFAAAFVQAPPQALDGPSDVFLARLGLPPSRMRLRVRPRTVRAGARTRFMFQVTEGSGAAARPVQGARIAFAGRRARTGQSGRAALVARIRRPGRYRARASKPGLRPATATVRVTSATPRPR